MCRVILTNCPTQRKTITVDIKPGDIVCHSMEEAVNRVSIHATARGYDTERIDLTRLVAYMAYPVVRNLQMYVLIIRFPEDKELATMVKDCPK